MKNFFNILIVFLFVFTVKTNAYTTHDTTFNDTWTHYEVVHGGVAKKEVTDNTQRTVKILDPNVVIPKEIPLDLALKTMNGVAGQNYVDVNQHTEWPKGVFGVLYENIRINSTRFTVKNGVWDSGKSNYLYSDSVKILWILVIIFGLIDTFFAVTGLKVKDANPQKFSTLMIIIFGSIAYFCTSALFSINDYLSSEEIFVHLFIILPVVIVFGYLGRFLVGLLQSKKKTELS